MQRERTKLHSGYTIFCRETRETIIEEAPIVNRPVMIMQKLASVWDNLSENQKEEWREKAEKMNKEIRQQNIKIRKRREEVRLNRVFSPKVYILSDS